MSEIANTKRIAKNTLLMYFRMFFLIIISLYTSRVILKQLGVVDFGIYNVVGSIVLIFSSLKSMLASSTQRFLNFEMGRNNNAKLKDIYSMSVEINAIVSLLFVFVIEIAGVWFIQNKMNMPAERLMAAHVVLQLSILTTVVSFLNSPFDACIIAHEKMNYYAYISIFEGLLKLFICFMLSWWGSDKLILYGVLILIVSLIVFFFNLLYCRHKFKECCFNWIFDRRLFKEMSSFAGWAFLGNTAFSLSQSGVNLVLNLFGGPIVNTARGISFQVNNVFSSFISNISVVIRPYMIKTYSGGGVEKSMAIVLFSSKIYFFVQLVMALIMIGLSNYILKMWLGQIPDYTIIFVDLVLIYAVIRSLHSPLDMLFSAQGKYKYYQILEGTVLFLPVPFSYLLLKIGAPYYSAFITIILFEAIEIVFVLLLARKQCGFDLKLYLKEVVAPCTLIAIIAVCGFFLSIQFVNVIIKILSLFLCDILITLVFYKIGINSAEKLAIRSLIR